MLRQPCIGTVLAILLSAVAGPVAADQATFAGKWGTNNGEMTLQQQGGAVSGVYTTDEGRIAGEVQGRRLVGYWAEAGSGQRCDSMMLGSYYWGRIDFTLDSSNRRFDGAWSYCHATPGGGSAWTGERTATAGAEPVAPQPAAAFAGTWSTTEGTMTLNEGGAGISGNYGSDEGRISGEVLGKALLGYWAEKGSAQRCDSMMLGSYYWGRIDFRLDGSGRRFAGAWSYCHAKPTQMGSWTGERAAAVAVEQQPNAAFAGIWNTSEGTMTLSRSQDGISGSYGTDEGRIQGEVRGSTLVGFWAEKGSAQRCDTPMLGTYHWGRIEFAMDASGRHFDGAWSYCAAAVGSSRDWKGDRSSDLPPAS